MTLEQFAAANPSADPAETIRNYRNQQQLELLKSGEYDDLAPELDGVLQEYAATNGIEVNFNQRNDRKDLEYVSQYSQDPAAQAAARTYLAVDDPKIKDTYGDPVKYDEVLSSARAAVEQSINPIERNKARRAALDSGDTPFAVFQDPTTGEERLDVSPALKDLAGNDEALAAYFEANPDLDVSRIPEIRQKLKTPDGFTVPAFQIDRQHDWMGAFTKVLGDDKNIARKVSDLRAAADKGTPSNEALLDQIDTELGAYGMHGDTSPEAAVERKAYIKDFINMSAAPEVDEENLDNNIRTLSTGQKVLPMAVMLQRPLFDKVVASPSIPESQRTMLKENRDAQISAMAPEMFKTIAANRPMEFPRFMQERKDKGMSNAAILDEWMADPENYSQARSFLGGAGESVLEGFGGLVMYPAAMLGNESARKALTDLQKSDMDRRNYAQMFGKNLSVGYDLTRLVAPVAADVSVSLLTGGAATAAVTSKNIVKTGIKAALKGAVEAGAYKAFTRGAATQSVDQIIDSAGKNLARKFVKTATTASYLGTAFNRSAGSTYVQLYSQLSEEKNPDGSAKYTPEKAREIALNHGLIQGSLTALITGGFSFLGRGGIESIYSGMSRKQMGRIFDKVKQDFDSLAPSVRAGLDMTNVDSFVTSVAKKAVRPMLATVRKGTTDESMEEGLDQFAGYFNQQIATGDEINIADAFKQAGYAALLGGIMGAGVVGVREATAGQADIDTEALTRRTALYDIAAELDAASSPRTAEAVRRFAVMGFPTPTQEGVPAGASPEGGEQAPSGPAVAGDVAAEPLTPTTDGNAQADMAPALGAEGTAGVENGVSGDASLPGTSRPVVTRPGFTESDVARRMRQPAPVEQAPVEASTPEAETNIPAVSITAPTVKTEGSPYQSGEIETPDGKGHYSIKMQDDGTAVLADIQIGYEGDAGRGKGYGMEAYIQIGQELAKKGIILQSTRWNKHQTAVSPQALRVWEKLAARGLAVKTGESQSKVYDRQSGSEQIMVVPEYDFTGITNEQNQEAETPAPLTPEQEEQAVASSMPGQKVRIGARRDVKQRMVRKSKPQPTPTNEQNQEAQTPAPSVQVSPVPTGQTVTPSAVPAGSGAQAAATPEAQAPAAVAPPANPKDGDYEKLLKKGKPAGPNMVELTDKQVTPEIRKKLKDARSASGRMEETPSFYLRPKADVTGIPTDRGWILKDKRPDFAARSQPAQASTPAPEPEQGLTEIPNVEAALYEHPESSNATEEDAQLIADALNPELSASPELAMDEAVADGKDPLGAARRLISDMNPDIDVDMLNEQAILDMVGGHPTVQAKLKLDTQFYETQTTVRTSNVDQRPQTGAGSPTTESGGGRTGDAISDPGRSGVADDTGETGGTSIQLESPESAGLRGDVAPSGRTPKTSATSKNAGSTPVTGAAKELDRINYDAGVTKMLETIIADKKMPAMYRDLSKFLLNNFGEQIANVKLVRAYLPGHDVISELRGIGMEESQAKQVKAAKYKSISGVYLGNGQIIINISSVAKHKGGVTQTVLHELVHAITLASIKNPTPAQEKVLTRLDNIRRNVQKKAEKAKMKHLKYGLSNMDEFIAHFFTSPTFQRDVSALTPKGERNWVQVIVEAIKDLLNGKVRTQQDKVSQEIMSDLIAFTRDAAQTTYGPTPRMEALMQLPEGDVRNTARFIELTRGVTPENVEQWRAENPEAYEELRRMREEVLRDAGWGVGPVYHAGITSNISEFNSLTHFGSDIRQLEGIRNRRKSLKEKPADAEYEVLLKLENPKRVDDTWNWGARMSEAVSEGYDGLVYKNYGEGFNTDEGATFKDSYVPANPTQIKSTEPINFDSENQLILPHRWADAGSPDIRFQLPEGDGDAEYLAAVERGDMETAQRMVDEAAELAGDPESKFNVVEDVDIDGDKILRIDLGDYQMTMSFPSRYYIDNDGKRRADSYFHFYPTGNPNATDEQTGTYRPGLRHELLYSGRRLANEARRRGWTPLLGNNEYRRARIYSKIDWTTSSLDPVTYDDQGNVIPLSQRFNTGSPDIRFQIPEAPHSPDLVRAIAAGFTPEDVDLDINFDALIEGTKGLNPVNREHLIAATVNRALSLKAGFDALGGLAGTPPSKIGETQDGVAIYEVDAEDLGGAFGLYTKTSNDDPLILVSRALPKRVKDFVIAHETYHSTDAKFETGGELRAEIMANLMPGFKDPVGLMRTALASMTPERLQLYANRLRGEGPTLSDALMDTKWTKDGFTGYVPRQSSITSDERERLTRMHEMIMSGYTLDSDIGFYRSNPTAMQNLVRFLTAAVKAAYARLKLRFDNRTAVFIDRMTRELSRAKEGYHTRSTRKRFDPADPDGNAQYGPRFLFAGEQAEMPQFRRDSLETARAMAAAGKSTEEIRAVTGWFPGKYDGKMRWEIPDSGAKLTDKWAELEASSAFGPKPSIRLDEAITHPDLFTSYPELAGVVVSKQRGFFDVFGAMQGWFNPETNTLNVTPNAKEPLSTMLHEIQHWVQTKEGFAKGSNTEAAMKGLSPAQKQRTADQMKAKAEELIAREEKNVTSAEAILTTLGNANAAEFDFLVDAKNKAQEDFLTAQKTFGTGTPQSQRTYKILTDAEKSLLSSVGIVNALSNWDVAYPIKTAASFDKLQSDTLKKRDKARETIINHNNLLTSMLDSDEQFEKAVKAFNLSYELYKNVAGEIEARDVQSRATLTPEQLAATAPYSSENIAPEDAIVLMDGGTSALFQLPEPGTEYTAWTEVDVGNKLFDSDPNQQPRGYFGRMFKQSYDVRDATAAVLKSRDALRRGTQNVIDVLSAKYQRALKEGADPDLLRVAIGSNKPMLTLEDELAIEAEFNIRNEAASNIAAPRIQQAQKDRAAARRRATTDEERDAVEEAYDLAVQNAKALQNKAFNEVAEWERTAMRDRALVNGNRLREQVSIALEKLKEQSPIGYEWAFETRKTLDEIIVKDAKEYANDRPELAWVMDNSQGVYLVRTFNFHRDPTMADKLLHSTDPAFVELQEVGINFFGKHLADLKVEELRENPAYADYDELSLRAQALTEVREEAKKLFEDYVMGQEGASAPAGSGLHDIRTEFQRFLRKKDLPDEILQILGEIDDPLFNSMRTFSSVTGILFNQRMLKAVRKDGLKNGWLIDEATKTADKKYSTWVPFVAANEKSESYAPLAGLYAAPKDVEALKAALNVGGRMSLDTAGKTYAAANRALIGAAGLSMGVMTLGSVGYFSRNMVSGVIEALAQGTNPFSKTGWESIKKSYLASFGKDTDADVQELIARGVLGDGVNIAYMKEFLQKYREDPINILKWAEDKGFKLNEQALDKLRTAGGGWTKMTDFLSKAAEFTETFKNPLIYFSEFDALMDSGLYEGNEEGAKQEAARRTKFVTTVGSENPQAVTQFSKNPLAALMAPFIRYKAGVMRTTWNTYVLAIQDINSGNPTMRAHGFNRMQSAMVIHGALTIGLPLFMQWVLGISDEEDEAIRKGMPSYSRNSTFIYFKNRETGELTTWDLSFTNTFSFVFDPFVQAIKAGGREDYSEIPAIATRFVTSDLMGEQIVAGKALDVSRNIDESTGLPIYMDVDNMVERFTKSAMHILEGSYTPQVVRKAFQAAEATYRPDTDEEPFFYTPLGILVGHVAPVRPRSHKPEDLAYRAFRNLQKSNAELWQITGPMSSPAPMDPEDVTGIYEKRKRAGLKVWQEMYRTGKAFQELGLTQHQVARQATDAGLSKKRVGLAMNGFMERPVIAADKAKDIREIDERRLDVYREAVRKTPQFIRLD